MAGAKALAGDRAGYWGSWWDKGWVRVAVWPLELPLSWCWEARHSRGLSVTDALGGAPNLALTLLLPSTSSEKLQRVGGSQGLQCPLGTLGR